MSPGARMQGPKIINPILFKKNYVRQDCHVTDTSCCVQSNRVQYGNKMIRVKSNSKIDDDYKENFFENLENDYEIDLYCHENMSDISTIYNESNNEYAYKKIEIILKNDQEATICKLAENAKQIFHKLQEKQTYSFIIEKRDRIIQAMIAILRDCEDKTKIQSVTKSIIISSIAMLDWICAFKNNYFCDENEKRICCFCIIECMKARRSYADLYYQHQDIFEMYEKSCIMIYGEKTVDKQICNYQKSQILTDFLIDENYEDSSYIALLECYKDKLDDGEEEFLTECLYILAIRDISCKFMDIYEEFAESILKNSSNTTLNFEIMHDYVAIVSR